MRQIRTPRGKSEQAPTRWRRQWPILATLTAFLLSAGLAAQAMAQNSQRKRAQPAKPAVEKSEDKKPVAKWTPPPYEARLLRLSELMGALSYLERLCDGENKSPWRANMQQLMQAEAKNEAQKARLAGAFNAGFRGYQLNYRRCTDHARLVISRSLQEGEKIASDVANRYGGG